MKRKGLWVNWKWGEVETIVRELACGLAAQGLKPNDKVAIIGSNIPELYFAMIAAQCLGAVPVPIHQDSSAEELSWYFNNCEAKFAIVQDQQQVDGLYAIKEQCENFEQMVYCDGRGMQDYTSSRLNSFLQIQENGKKFAADHTNFFEDVTGKITQDSDAFILYTSGTSEPPRGAVHTHSSLISTGRAFADQEKIKQDEEEKEHMNMFG